MSSADLSSALCERVRQAHVQKSPLVIRGGETKSFYGRACDGEPIDLRQHSGIVRYEPTELVITARSGTLLTEIEQALSEHRQMLPFEPPHYGEYATLGGAVAAGLSGPRRPYCGAIRDNILGVRLINGQGEHLHFGGEVMKNVAGYDVSRLMAGSLGTLGILTEISVKVLPQPSSEITLVQTLSPADAIQNMATWAKQPYPLSATWHDGNDLYLRLSGERSALQVASKIIGGDLMDWSDVFWKNIQEQSDVYFMDNTPLWRIAVPPATPPLNLAGTSAMEWNGGLRWLKSEIPAADIRSTVEAKNGHALLFRNGDPQGEVFHPLPQALLILHKNLKQAFDPAGILNPGRMYPEI